MREQQVRTDKKVAQLGLQFEVVRERRLFYGLSWCGVFVSAIRSESGDKLSVSVCFNSTRKDSCLNGDPSGED